MKRNKTILLHFQKAGALTVSNIRYREQLEQHFSWLINSDDVTNDITTKTLDLNGKGTAQIFSKQEGVISGLEEVTYLLGKYTKLVFIPKVLDADHVVKDTIIAEVSGENSEILAYERTILNILGRMSGIATETYVQILSIADIPGVPYIASMRKTPLMFLDKKAVAVGGGLTHRLNLSDSILIKDNHLAMVQKKLHLASLEEAAWAAVRLCMEGTNTYFEIEVDTLAQANAVLHTFVQENTKQNPKKTMAILLDNFKPHDATRFVESLKKLPVYEWVLIEASGEITKNNLSSWAITGVDVVSMGVLTHSPKVFNFSLAYE